MEFHGLDETLVINIPTGLHSITTHRPTTLPDPLLVAIGFVNFVLLVPMLVMFHRRKSALVRWVVIYGIYAVLCECHIQYLHIIARSSTTLAGNVSAVVIEALLMAGTVAYFFKSSRVKRTFVR